MKRKTSYKHSFFGKMLVDNFPDKYKIGNRAAHYHCNTRAKELEKEYGIGRSNDSET